MIGFPGTMASWTYKIDRDKLPRKIKKNQYKKKGPLLPGTKVGGDAARFDKMPIITWLALNFSPVLV